MTQPRTKFAGVGYALAAAGVAVPAVWQASFGDFSLAMWMLAVTALAARCSSALQTIARLQVRLADPRRWDQEGPR